ncbi:MAG TPA: hypothetical protein VE866_16290, partial [Candidatus Binatia bacterium]|nr:hypothetical protein [Candidatus Binatia bacterium]
KFASGLGAVRSMRKFHRGELGDEHDAENWIAELPTLRPVRNLYVETYRHVGGACSLAPASACAMPELHSSLLPAAVDRHSRSSEQAASGMKH